MNRMKKAASQGRTLAHALILALLGGSAVLADEPPKAPRLSVEEARERARLLHDTLHDTLQIVHDQYFREDEGLMIPAASFKHLFQRMADRHGVKLHWLAVEGRAMNIDHRARDEFEKEAVKALASGKDEHEVVAGDVYRHAGAITLRAECLKCHFPSRSSNKSRSAGLVIDIPVANPGRSHQGHPEATESR